MAKPVIPEFSTGGPLGAQALTLAVRWEDELGFRYHIWFGRNADWSPGALVVKWLPKRDGPRGRNAHKVMIIKNSPKGFAEVTRRLDGESPKWAAVVEAAAVYANSGEPERIKAEAEAKEEADSIREAEAGNEAHGAATKERLLAWANTMPNGPDMGRFRQVVGNLTNKQANMLSAYVHDLVRP